MGIITTERLTKILSETQAVISECNSRGVHGSVEVNSRLFENVLMELLRHRAAMLQGADGNSPVIPDGWVMVPVEPTEAMINAYRDALYSDESAVSCIDLYKAMIAAAPTHSGTNDGWVACSERMPVDAEQVYLFTNGVVLKDAFYNADEQLFYWEYSADTCKASDASHWMPMIMPAAPQQEVK